MPESSDHTVAFQAGDPANDPKTLLTQVYRALREKGYNPIDQIVGYLISGDPAYITGYRDARLLITRIERDEILEALLRSYLGV